MFCQACGVQNAEDARFCNMCGTRIAKPGAPGGMIVDKTQFGIGPSELEGGAEAAAATADGEGAVGGDAPTAPAAEASVAVGGALGAPSASVSRPRVSLQGPMPAHGGPSMMSVSLGGIGVQSSARAWITLIVIVIVLVGGGAVATWFTMKSSADRIAASGRAEPDDPFVIGTPQPVGETDGRPGNPETPAAPDAGGGSTPPPPGPDATQAGTPGPGPGPGPREPGGREPTGRDPGGR
jgi:hypothetical protein